jgi:hypothetical protein
VQFRRDRLAPVSLYHTEGRRRLSTTREDRVGQTMTGVYAQTEIEWTRTLRTMTTVEPRSRIFASIRARHFGPRPLIEDASANSKSTTLWNGEIGYGVSSRARVVLELFNIFDADASDVDYFYTSRLRGEPIGGVDDIHTHPALPRSARLGLQLSF